MSFCNKCKQCPPAENDTWCLGCSGWESLGLELASGWHVASVRATANDAVLNCVRQVRSLRNLSSSLRSAEQARASGSGRAEHSQHRAPPVASGPPRLREASSARVKEEKEPSGSGSEQSGEDESEEDDGSPKAKVRSDVPPPEPAGISSFLVVTMENDEKEGEEFTVVDGLHWASLVLKHGDIIEVEGNNLDANIPVGTSVAFLVMECALSGGMDLAYVLVVKSIGSSDPEVAKRLSHLFNRKEGKIHVCGQSPCMKEGDFVFHVASLKRYTTAGFSKGYVTAAMWRQIKKWLQVYKGGLEAEEEEEEDDGGGEEEEPPDELIGGNDPLASGRDGKEKTGGPSPKPGGTDPTPKRGPRKDPPGTRRKKGKDGEEKAKKKPKGAADPPERGPVSEKERARLRERLAQSRARLQQTRTAPPAIADKPKSGDKVDVHWVESSSPEMSPSVAREDLVTGNELAPVPGLKPISREVKLAKKKERKKSSKEGTRQKQKGAPQKKKPSIMDQVDTKGTTTASLQNQLAIRAVQAVEDRRSHRKAKKSKNKPVALLCKLLGLKGAGDKHKEKKKKARKKRQRVKKERGESDSPGDPYSSGDDGDSSYGDGSEEDFDGDEASSSSSSRKMEPPLKKRSLEKPGSVLKMLVDHARSQLDQTGKVTVGRHSSDDPTQGVRITSYFGIVVKPQVGQMTGQMREMHHLSNAVDLLRAGELDSLGDLLASRFMALHQSVIDGHWQAARHLEMNPLENVSAAGPAVVLQARKHARLAARVEHGDGAASWNPAGRAGAGRGKGGWSNVSPWQTDGKRGDKGKGKGKPAGKYSPAEGDDSTKKKEKVAFKHILPSLASLVQLGCTLAWWVLATGGNAMKEGPVATLLKGEWMGMCSAKAQSFLPRQRGATFPLRLGALQEFVNVITHASLALAVSEAFGQQWGVDAWMFLSFCALNGLSNSRPLPQSGKWSQVEQQAAASIRAAAARLVSKDKPAGGMSLESWQKDMSSKAVGYNGEEISICHQLTWEQVLPGLPPESHGASIEALDWVNPRTREFLLHPSWLLKDPAEVVLPKMPGRIHVEPGDKFRLADELVRRNICDWIPLSTVYEVDGVKILNGLFGVVKPTLLDTGPRAGQPVLRLIMNLTGSNATQLQLEGGTSSLPSIVTWQSLVLDGDQTLELFQSDMSSAFYLFKLPQVWKPHLSFNIIHTPRNRDGSLGAPMALCCNVIPMGWLSSVSIMQEIAENLMKRGLQNPFSQLCRAKPLPPWFNDILSSAVTESREWWHVYLDNFAAGEKISPDKPGERGRRCHQLAEALWDEAGVASSKKKRVHAAKVISELGAEVNGEDKTLGVSMTRLLQLVQSTLWLLEQRFLNRKHVQILAGRWVFALQFRRPAMSFLQFTWKFVGGASKVTDSLRQQVRRELLCLVWVCPLLHCNLAAPISPRIFASDASSSGGAVGMAEKLTPEGEDMLVAIIRNDLSSVTPTPILLVSLFNGIGGCFRCYDVAGVVPMGRIAAECDAGANRITERRWPGVIIIKDVKDINRKVVSQWSRQFLGIQEVHLWAGFPCKDLSAAKYKRENLSGPNSSLFYHIPRIRSLLEEEFGSTVAVKSVVENVASMDEEAAGEISSTLDCWPYRVDSVDAVPLRRPRFCWTSETLDGCLLGLAIEEKRVMVRLLAGRLSRAQRARARAKVRLDDAALSPQTQSRYYLALRLLVPILELVTSEDELDTAISNWVRSMWEAGEPLLTVGDGLSALHFFQPWTKRRIPHAWKLFGVWRKIEVPSRAPPLTLRLVRSLAAYCIAFDQWELAVLLMIGFHCLLRTGELLALVPSDFLIGSTSGLVTLRNTKTGKRDNACDVVSITDHVVLELLVQFLALRQSLPGPAIPIWSGSPALFRKRFAAVCNAAGLERHQFRPYSLRRGGATHEFQTSRSMEHTLCRGRWQSSRVARVYINDGMSVGSTQAGKRGRVSVAEKFFFRATSELEATAFDLFALRLRTSTMRLFALKELLP
eukprot:Skav233267  [mRNA]  locus=scaffold4476:143528:150960:- [translate_table: standard]